MIFTYCQSLLLKSFPQQLTDVATFQKSSAVAAFLLFGWSLAAAALSYIYHQLYEYLTDYKHYVVAYMVVTGFISFAVCYRYGPISSKLEIYSSGPCRSALYSLHVVILAV